MGYNHRYNFAKLVFHSSQPAISSDFKSFDKPPNQQKTQTCDKSIGRSCTTQITEHLQSSNEILKRFFVRYGVRDRPQNVRYGENASEHERIRTMTLNLFQTHILRLPNSSECEKFIPGRALLSGVFSLEPGGMFLQSSLKQSGLRLN
jgi:hypothetical protein